MTSAEGENALDGLKIDQKGNLYVSRPGGLWIISLEGKHLGTIAGPEHPHNFASGDDEGKTLEQINATAHRSWDSEGR
jgi:gluconolactonase